MKRSEKTLDIIIFGGNYIGKGAEAMMLVTRDQIKKKLPNTRFWISPGNPSDAEKLKNDGFNLIYKKSSNRALTAINILVDLLSSLFRNKKRNLRSGQRLNNVFGATDAVVDISGFAFSDKFGPRGAKSRWVMYLIAAFLGNKIIFMPQSWGPFQNKEVRRYTRRMLKNADLIFAREKTSYQHLIDAKCAKSSDVIYCNDIAFLFDVENHEKLAEDTLSRLELKDPSLTFVTITPNMQVYSRMEGEDANNGYIKLVLETILYFLNHTKSNVILIPHEASFRRRNDMELCVLLKELANTPQRIGILYENETAEKVKAVIGNSEFLVASRYHSLVAALSLRIPVGVIGWAHKYDELMQIAGLSEYIIDPFKSQKKSITVEPIIKAYQERDTIAKKIAKTVPQFKKNAEAGFEKVISVLNHNF